MITAHHTDAITLFDGETDHHVKHDDFDWMKPFDKGGIHPAITEEHHGYLPVDPRVDFSTCPIQPVGVTVDDPMRPGKQIAYLALPINAYLQAHYGPDQQIVTVPINGDAGAQRLHWIKRTPEEQAEMKALLKWMNAWRLREDGTVPDEGEYVIHGTVDHRAAMLPPEGV